MSFFKGHVVLVGGVFSTFSALGHVVINPGEYDGLPPVDQFPNSAFLANGTTDFNGIAYFDQIPVYGE